MVGRGAKLLGSRAAPRLCSAAVSKDGGSCGPQTYIANGLSSIFKLPLLS